MDVYNFSTRQWSQRQVPPRYGHVAAVHDNILYLVGGQFGSDAEYPLDQAGKRTMCAIHVDIPMPGEESAQQVEEETPPARPKKPRPNKSAMLMASWLTKKAPAAGGGAAAGGGSRFVGWWQQSSRCCMFGSILNYCMFRVECLRFILLDR